MDVTAGTEGPKCKQAHRNHKRGRLALGLGTWAGNGSKKVPRERRVTGEKVSNGFCIVSKKTNKERWSWVKNRFPE